MGLIYRTLVPYDGSGSILVQVQGKLAFELGFTSERLWGKWWCS